MSMTKINWEKLAKVEDSLTRGLLFEGVCGNQKVAMFTDVEQATIQIQVGEEVHEASVEDLVARFIAETYPDHARAMAHAGQGTSGV